MLHIWWQKTIELRNNQCSLFMQTIVGDIGTEMKERQHSMQQQLFIQMFVVWGEWRFVLAAAFGAPAFAVTTTTTTTTCPI